MSQPSSMSFSVRNDASGLEYSGTSLNGLFAQRRNLLRPGFIRMLAEILRFHREARALLLAQATSDLGDQVARVAIALLVRLWAAAQIPFAIPEDTAYYWGVARNLAEGRGFVSDAMWSYATEARDPATGAFGFFFPRAAFEIWLPLPSLLGLLPMLVGGSTAYGMTLPVARELAKSNEVFGLGRLRREQERRQGHRQHLHDDLGREAVSHDAANAGDADH